MTSPLSQYQLNEYLFQVRNMDSLDYELSRIQKTMVDITKEAPTTIQRQNVVHINQIFRVLLAEKTRQEIVYNLRDNNRRNTENSGTSPADDSP